MESEARASASFVRRVGARRVALQFPDGLLGLASGAAAALRLALGGAVEVSVLADTTFGPCCVDEVAAAHAGCDAVVHYGRACLSPTCRLPARFVLGRAELRDAGDAAERIAEAARAAHPRPTLVLGDLEYAHALRVVERAARRALGGDNADNADNAGAPTVIFGALEPLERVPGRPQPGTGGARLASVAQARAGECASADAACGRPPTAGAADADASEGTVRGVDRPAASEGAETSGGADEAQDAEGGGGAGRQYSLGGLSFMLPVAAPAGDGGDDNADGGSGALGYGAAPDVALVWIGAEGPPLTAALMTLAPTSYSRYDPAAQQPWSADEAGASRALQRRYFLVEKARDAAIVGVLAGTLGVAGYEAAIERVVQLVERAGKKAYVLAMGKPNPAKLANFPEIGVYVLVACAQTALIDSRDYYQPVLTVFEAELAFGDRPWPGHLRLDSGALAEAATAEGGAAAARGGEEEEARFSMVRGAYVAATASEGEGGAASVGDGEDDVAADKPTAGSDLAVRTERALRLRDGAGTVAEASSAAEYLLLKRSYQGLEAELAEGQAERTDVEEGWVGRAAGYAHDDAVGAPTSEERGAS